MNRDNTQPEADPQRRTRISAKSDDHHRDRRDERQGGCNKAHDRHPRRTGLWWSLSDDPASTIGPRSSLLAVLCHQPQLCTACGIPRTAHWFPTGFSRHGNLSVRPLNMFGDLTTFWDHGHARSPDANESEPRSPLVRRCNGRILKGAKQRRPSARHQPPGIRVPGRLVPAESGSVFEPAFHLDARFAVRIEGDGDVVGVDFVMVFGAEQGEVVQTGVSPLVTSVGRDVRESRRSVLSHIG